MICWKCRKEITVEQIFRNTECPLCHADLHVCKGCKFFVPGNHFECRENITDPVTDKEKSNFCDYFAVVQSFNEEKSSSEKARAAAASLFGDEIKTSTNDSTAAKNAFNSLFGD